MSLADNLFIDMCEDIIENGYSSEGHNVRPRWEDGTPAHTIKRFGVINRYDLQKEFPALTLRKTYIKSAVNEMLWIWQKQSNNIKDLNSHIWDEWADKYGSIGKAYGYQQGLIYPYTDVSHEKLKKAFPKISETKEHHFQLYEFDKHVVAVRRGDVFYMTQLDKAIYDLINNPLSRRIIVTMWNPKDLSKMNLEPCAYSMTFNVTENRLNGILNQRSQDILAANNWNVVQYAVLMHMIAQTVGLIPGELVHVIADAHIYDRHIKIVEELIKREPFDAPIFELNPNITNFYDFTEHDVRILGYNTHPQITDIPIAI